MSKTALLIAILTAVLVVQNATHWFRGFKRRRVARRRARRAAAGEVEAEALAKQLGYRVVERQAATVWQIQVDGEPTPIALRADLMLSKGGRRFVADVKTGQKAPSITNSKTRRQLLEYFLAYDVDGVVLIDMTDGRLRHVDFGPVERRVAMRLGPLVGAFLLGAAAALAFGVYWSSP